MTAARAIWVGLAGLAAVWCLAFGVPLWLSLGAFGCAVLPPLAGTFMRRWAGEAQAAEIESALWIGLATLGAASTGGATALVILFAVAVAAAMRSGDRRLTFEIAGFAVFGLAVAVLASNTGAWLQRNDAALLSAAYGVAGLVQLALSAAIEMAMRPPSSGVVAPLKPATGAPADPEAALKLKQIETRLKMAAAAAEEARQEADAARQQLEARTTFFAQTSHELRTPLNAIVGFADMMRNGVFGPLPERYQEYAGLIHEGGRSLSLIVDDVVDLARLEAGRYEIVAEPVSLTDLLADAVRFMADEAKRKGIVLELEGEEDVEAFADSKAVRQIALNLISNALKFTPQGGRVEVSAANTAGGAVLTVSDTGVGIDPDELKRLSRAFEQGSAGKKQKGAGLGLSVVRAFAELHGGRLEIGGREGGGTVISVFFPAETRAPDGGNIRGDA